MQLSQDLLIHPEQRVPVLPAPALIGQLGKIPGAEQLDLAERIWQLQAVELARLAAAMADWTVEY